MLYMRSPDGRIFDVSRQSQAAAGLDVKILQILNAYFGQYPGAPKISLNELIELVEIKRAEVIECLFGLREKGWLNYDLAEGAESGMVWLTKEGIRVAKDLSKS